MSLLTNKRVLLCSGGGIAAYKTPELVRRLRDQGADVHVMLTSAAQRFVSTLALEVVSKHPVGVDLWSTDGKSQIVHTDAGKDADVIIVAPATANLIARVRHGFADDLVTTTIMASDTPVLLCPSMNTDMLDNPLVRENIDALAALPRYRVLEPGKGDLACGVIGRGRMPDPIDIIEAARAALSPNDLSGRRVVVTAGPTREDLDPVRFITNRSTGTMGFALARAFGARGADVTLIAGPVAKRSPVGVARRVDFVTAADLERAVLSHVAGADLLVMAAAVADYRPATRSATKIKKQPGDMSLPLERTTDILASLVDNPVREGVTVVGFAAETDDVERRAKDKLKRKKMDWIVANDVSRRGVGFGTGDNEGLLVSATGVTHVLERADKQAFAERIVETLAAALVGQPS